MSSGLALALARSCAAVLGVAAARPRYPPVCVAAIVGGALLVAVGAVGPSRAGDALRGLAPTVGFLAALLLIAEGCRREGLFEAHRSADGARLARAAPSACSPSCSWWRRA